MPTQWDLVRQFLIPTLTFFAVARSGALRTELCSRATIATTQKVVVLAKPCSSAAPPRGRVGDA